MSTVNNELFTETEIIDRAKTIARIETDKDFADILGVSSADFGQRKKRGTLLPLITRWAIKRNVDLNYLLKGSSSSVTGALDPDPEVAELMEGARRVLCSGNPIAFDALERNIRYFDHAIAAEKRADAAEEKIREVENTLVEIQQSRAELKSEKERRKAEGEAQSSAEKAA